MAVIATPNGEKVKERRNGAKLEFSIRAWIGIISMACALITAVFSVGVKYSKVASAQESARADITGLKGRVEKISEVNARQTNDITALTGKVDAIKGLVEKIWDKMND